MLSKTIQTTMRTFIRNASEAAKITDNKIQEMQDQRMYSMEYLEKEKAKIEEVKAVALEMLRQRASSEIKDAFTNARACIENTVAGSCYNTEIEELKNILTASGGNLSEFEINVILDKVAGNYWGLKMLYSAVSDKTDAKKILAEKFTEPNPEYYIMLFAEMENKLLSFVQTYDGMGGNAVTAFGEILLNDDFFENFHKRIDINPLYIGDNELTVPTLSPSDRRELRKSGIVLDTSNKEGRQIAIESAHTQGHLRNILIRTCFSDIIKAEEKRIKEEQADDAQIKYKGAWRDVATAGNVIIY